MSSTLHTEQPHMHEAAQHAVLCWLATVDAQGCPNVSPKEVWHLHGDDHVLVAHIASPQTVRNLADNPHACLSFIDIFAQRGYKLKGVARVVRPQHADFAALSASLARITQGRFPIQAVIDMQVQAVEHILAPSYLLFPGHTTEADQIANAMQRYGVMPAAPGSGDCSASACKRR